MDDFGIVEVVIALIGIVVSVVGGLAIAALVFAGKTFNKRIDDMRADNQSAHDTIGRNIDNTRAEVVKQIQDVAKDTKELSEKVGYLSGRIDERKE